MRTVDLGKNSMGRLCLLGLLSLQSTLTSATTHEPSGATGPAVFNLEIARSHSLRHFKNDDGTVNPDRLHSHHEHLEAKYLRNFYIANSKNEVTPPFPNTANPLQKRGVSPDLQNTLVVAQAIEANFKAKMKTKGKLDKRAGGTRASRVALDGVTCASGVVHQVLVKIGTPPKAFSFTLDSGSGLSWVRSECKDGDEQQCAPDRSRLSLRDSTTLMKSNVTWSTSYVSGETSGYFVRDVFQIGLARYDQQVFASASKISQMINMVPTDGVLGASFSTIAKAQTPTFLENLIKSQLIEQPIMSFAMKGGPSPPHGSLIIGGMDENVIQPGTLRYHPVTSVGYWQVKAAGLTAGGKVVPGTEMDCAMDTGSAILYLPSAVTDAFFAALPGAIKSDHLGWTVPCKSLPTIKTIGIAFSNVIYSIPILSLVIGTDPDDSSQCKLAISSSSSTDINGKPVAIIGTVFLQHVYTVLSYSNNKQPAVGFASFVGSELVIESVDGAALPPANDPSPPPSDKDVKPKSIALSTQSTDTKLPANKTQTPPTTQTPVHGPSKDAGKSNPDHGGEGGGEPTPGPDLKKGSPPDLPETTRHAAKKVEPPQDTEAGRPDPKEKDATKPHGKGVETPVPDVKGTKQHDAGGKSTPVAKEQPGAKDIGPKEGPPERPPTPSDFHAPEESDSTKNMTAKNPVPKSKADKVAPEKSQHPEEHKPAASDKTPEAKGTKKEHNQAAGGKDKDGKTLPPADQQADFGPPTVQKVPSLNISGNGSDSQPGAPGGTNNSNPVLLGNGTLPPDSFKPAQESHSAAPAIVSSVWSSSAVLVLVSAGFLLFGI
ncbi:BZ3500_MvSof-1268-A1-R1_Chr6-2g08490 [Microbotryum saponariae]|uniref:BZ3500_MvSof-1268-A1-R1_Chr6-2g08490 protein n=1 Tax=Microbotryum saponariae TaxID=289078 RepID=A0A2X0KP10_9BASI|nr:BZ3500_MvSof-1268-A1-R1_Chr6-2g08490 [Microbotryum saponariae]SDA07767.1 BZ3501_MvSof-1269-A2-R1_Chr6-1g08204 [Microbotryum saponariae]